MKKLAIVSSLLLTAALNITPAHADNVKTSAEKDMGFLSGAIAGAVIGGPVGFFVGGISGAMVGEEVAKAIKLIEKIATKGPVAIQKVIEAVNAYFTTGENGFAAEVDGFGEVTKTKDFEEGASAFIKKRKPNFKGC